MKRVLFLGILILFSIYSCKKEKEGLALFVIGNWKSQELTLVTQSEGVPGPVGFYTIKVKDDDTYVLTFEGFDCGADKYSITGDEIYLKEFNVDPVWGDPPGPAKFTVSWAPGETQMTWTCYDGSAGDLPPIIWTKQ